MAGELALIGLGSNLGDSAALLRSALQAMNGHADLSLQAVSPFYRSTALQLADDAPAQPDYCNAVAAVRTTLQPHALLDCLLHIEQLHGRTRSVHERWQARRLDLDLLAYGDQVVATADLTIPHPEIARRNFVMRPWADIASDFGVLAGQDTHAMSGAGLSLWAGAQV